MSNDFDDATQLGSIGHNPSVPSPVSYTHLDVYKRQSLVRADRQMSENPMIACAAKP